jgi:hypothetical protein
VTLAYKLVFGCGAPQEVAADKVVIAVDLEECHFPISMSILENL